MTVRILCLHGMGTNAKIFAAQTAYFRAMLPSSYEFVFLPGNLACEAAEGVTAFYPGPYKCWYDTPSTANIEKAQALVLNYARKAGPFDGVMGFSQGAALAASIMLRFEASGAPSPFKFAIFMGSALPCSESTSRGIDLRIPFGCVATKPTTTQQIPEHLLSGPTPDDSKASVTERFKPGQGDSYYQMYHPSVDEIRIKSPTVHVIGARDKWRMQTRDLVGLCAKESAFVMEHPLGHEMPPRAMAEDLCDLIETVVSLGLESTRMDDLGDTGLAGRL